MQEMQETEVQSLGQEGPLEKKMATHSSILAWKIPWMEEPGGLQHMVSQNQTWLSTYAHLKLTQHCESTIFQYKKSLSASDTVTAKWTMQKSNLATIRQVWESCQGFRGRGSRWKLWKVVDIKDRHSETAPRKLVFVSEVKVAQSCPTLCNPMDYTVHGILQAGVLEWVAFPFSRGSSQPRDQTRCQSKRNRSNVQYEKTFLELKKNQIYVSKECKNRIRKKNHKTQKNPDVYSSKVLTLRKMTLQIFRGKAYL